jgi:hypothetical protein
MRLILALLLCVGCTYNYYGGDGASPRDLGAYPSNDACMRAMFAELQPDLGWIEVGNGTWNMLNGVNCPVEIWQSTEAGRVASYACCAGVPTRF